MFLMWIVPLVLIGLVIWAISGNNLANAFKSVAGHTCPNCNRPAQVDWKTCPYCGQTL